ncbi:type II toxin-antitoxin system RelE/ParE family toxin [Terasakiella sp. SH-1]|uniref:type II toxin-antitoxin system RelE/ParE family toxin n=1 Tax=Terasakiella sp. SH-1 TaxID=2560057 RepID=UPI001430E04A|nr:type II toxin-antitoxin system RelE/ParE family toxin [Terasakiella sp. SH-1]
MDEILEYVFQENPTAVENLLNSFDEKLSLLAHNPMMGVQRDRLMLGLRVFSVGNFLLCYFPVENGVEVARILHGARDVHAAFKSN